MKPDWAVDLIEVWANNGARSWATDHLGWARTSPIAGLAGQDDDADPGYGPEEVASMSSSLQRLKTERLPEYQAVLRHFCPYTRHTIGFEVDPLLEVAVMRLAQWTLEGL